MQHTLMNVLAVAVYRYSREGSGGHCTASCGGRRDAAKIPRGTDPFNMQVIAGCIVEKKGMPPVMENDKTCKMSGWLEFRLWAKTGAPRYGKREVSVDALILRELHS